MPVNSTFMFLLIVSNNFRKADAKVSTENVNKPRDEVIICVFDSKQETGTRRIFTDCNACSTAK